MIIFKNYGIIISKEDNKFFVEYSDGSFAEKIVRDEITEEESNLAMVSRENAAKLIETLGHRKADTKLKNKVKEYIMANYKMNEKQSESATTKLYGEKDIFLEFVQYIALNDFLPEEYDPIRIEGYTAQMIESTTYLNALGAYNYLVYLRNNPKEALVDLKKGLPKR